MPTQQATNFPGPFLVSGVPTLGTSGIPLTSGVVFFVDYVNGGDGNSGAANAPLKTVYRAHALAVAGRGDVVVVVSDGASTGTQRLSLANAQAVDSSVTAGTLVWSKNNTHLVGMCSPTMVSQRARFAPPTGTYTVTTFGSANFVTVTASGCIFKNISIFNGFSTGGAAQICWTDTGSRNYYENVCFQGMADAGSAGDADSRCLKVGAAGSGENTFVNCVIGIDTVTRGNFANANLELAGATPRNVFIGCVFPLATTSATPLCIIAKGADALDRWNSFTGCHFLNAMSSGATAQTQIVSMTSASPGGYLVMDNCMFVGNASTNWGDTNALANIYVMGATPTAASNGIGINPS